MVNKDMFIFPYEIIIGKQAEYCFEYYLKYSKRYELTASNIQINGEIETLGEIDYLVFDSKTQQALHVELACKFYLCDSSSNESGIDDWVGPNRKDSLKKKLDKLNLKQFPIIKLKESKAVLNTFQIDANTLQQQLCLKVFLFLRKGSMAPNLSKNYQNCVVGYWLPYIEFNSEEKTGLYAIPKKKEWLLPIENSREWFSFYAVNDLIKTEIENKKSVLVYKKTGAQIIRFFVVWW